MVFFIVYGTSDAIFVKTSVCLPLFVGFFILIQFGWSVHQTSTSIIHDIEGGYYEIIS